MLTAIAPNKASKLMDCCSAKRSKSSRVVSPKYTFGISGVATSNPRLSAKAPLPLTLIGEAPFVSTTMPTGSKPNATRSIPRVVRSRCNGIAAFKSVKSKPKSSRMASRPGVWSSSIESAETPDRLSNAALKACKLGLPAFCSSSMAVSNCAAKSNSSPTD